MSVEPSEVQVGRCFITASNQVRKVIEITTDDRVNYSARGSEYKDDNSWGLGPNLSNLPSRAAFARAVDRRVKCDWDKNYPERDPADEDAQKKSS